jgi:hypothetical protein
MALERYHLGQSTEGEAFAYPKSGPRIVSLLGTGKNSLRKELARAHVIERGTVAGQQQLTDALTALEGLAEAEEPSRLWLRVAKHDGANYLDLGDRSGNAIRIAEGGWTIGQPPVLFKRTALTAALSVPERGGSLNDLWRHLTVAAEDRPLLLAYLVAALEPDIPHPALGIFGEQGTGKSSTVRALVSFIDPSPVPYRKPPRDEEGWIVGAAASWIVALDNLRTVPNWLSDLLCRAVTGEGDVRRRLFTNADLQTFAFRRVVILNGIDVGTLSGDLAERLLPITLERFGDDDRSEEAELAASLKSHRAIVLGALLDLAAGALQRAPDARIPRRPRMLDFARIVAAVDEVLGTDGFDRYMTIQTRLSAETVTSDPLTARLADGIREPFAGTASELLSVLRQQDTQIRYERSLPRDARTMTQLLRRVATDLRNVGWQVRDDGGRNKQRIARWTLIPPGEACRGDPPSPLDPPHTESRHEVGEASQADPQQRPKRQNGRRTAPVGSTAMCRRKSAGQAGQAGQASKPSLEDLLARAREHWACLPRDDRESLETRCSKAFEEYGRYPDWWRITAETDPGAVIVALELIAADRREHRPIAAPNLYLNAARETSRRTSTSAKQGPEQ